MCVCVCSRRESSCSRRVCEVAVCAQPLSDTEKKAALQLERSGHVRFFRHADGCCPPPAHHTSRRTTIIHLAHGARVPCTYMGSRRLVGASSAMGGRTRTGRAQAQASLICYVCYLWSHVEVVLLCPDGG